MDPAEPAVAAPGGVPVDVVRAATRRPDAEVGAVTRAAVAAVDNMTTLSIDRLSGALADGTPWSVVAKTLRPVWAAPAFAHVPEEHRATVIETLDWLDEPRIYRSGLTQGLPPGLRMPRLYAIEEADERVTLWLEDVADRGVWTVDRYRRTARCLGRMSGRWPGTRASSELGMRGRDIGTIFHGRTLNVDLPLHASDAFWSRPAVREAVDAEHRRDLFRLAQLMPELLRRLDDLPAALCHGDACPANLLEPDDGTVVAIDWSYGHVGALGSDLAQLIAGRFESGAARPEDLVAITDAFDGYLDGLACEGTEVDASLIEQAWVTHLAVRSVFSALILEPSAGPSDGDEAELLRSRAALGRFGLDLALRHATARTPRSG